MSLTHANAIHTRSARANAGFTLVEMLIAMVVGAILIGAIYSSYMVQEKASTVQRELARMENCLRASMYLMKTDLLNSGRDGDMNGTLGDRRQPALEPVQSSGAGHLR